MRNIDTNLIRAFVLVAESGMITSAANLMNLTQAAVSQQIQRLEMFFGCQLFEREQRGIKLTYAGEQLLDDAKKFLALNDQIWQKMSTQEYADEVKLGIPYDLASTYLSPLLKRFSTQHPEIKITSACLSSEKLLSALHHGDVDLTLVEELTPKPDAEVIAIESLVWVGAPNGRAHTKHPLPIAFGSHTCVFRPIVIETLRAAQIEWRIAATSDSIHALDAMISADLAITPLLTSTIPNHLLALPSNTSLPALPTVSVTLYLPKTSLSEAVKKVASYLRSHAKISPSDTL